ncbi:MAG: sensor histidine kinase [Desulfofustis sp.]|nr:sensor histidine kinase [Desulfofustis sp.]
MGRNFSYRPYFKQAMKGHLGRYFALGTTSIKRGYYFAYPVRRDNEILGAVVIKINIDSVEKKWGDHDEIFLVTDPDNVIFITTHSDWRFKTLGRVTPLTEDLIRKSKRYPNSDIEAIDYTKVKSYDFGSIINLKDQNNVEKTFLQQAHYMDEAGWNVQILSNISPLRKTIIGVNLLVTTGFLFSYLLLILLRQRRQRLEELKHFEVHARKVLQEANEKLETRVSERTRELVETNEKLLREINDRKNTEAILKRTRSELVHAAKMATLGQMSAGINHELNQPLAAIRSYADNARQLLAKERINEADWNMTQIGELTDRMAQLGIQLKEFSRKSNDQLDIVSLRGIVDGALEILSPGIRKNKVAIVMKIVPENLEIFVNQVLFQQVIVNLISNGMQAMENSNTKELIIEACEKENRVYIIIQDSGNGIAAENISRVFEPFFTTKPAGQGLGLGLTITERILKEMNGDITIESSERGARFLITFPAAVSIHGHG